jgi:predicted unusual protein kinase regulating ubiquinone biosynthesis (AarF/ABC1/UbiB family)
VAAASIGQVHRAIWKDGRQVAVKLQYPGAGAALLGDFRRLSQILRVTAGWVPGLDLAPLVREFEGRLAEELDYALEARRQRAFAAAFSGDESVFAPDVVFQQSTVLVSEWVGGRPLADIVVSGTPAERDHASDRYLEFLFSGPQLARLLHADPHPGNFRILPDGRLGVMDFGAVGVVPDGLPPAPGPGAAPRARRRRRGGAWRVARGGVRATRDRRGPACPAGLPAPLHRADRGGDVHVQQGLDG